MPISSISSYGPTITGFVTHWTAVNVFLGAGGPLLLPGPVGVVDLSDLGVELQNFAMSIAGKTNDIQIARQDLELSRIAILNRLGEFNRKVRGFLSHTAFVTALPYAPATNAGPGVVLAALDDMATLWAKINAATIPGFTGPLLLLGGYALAAFSTDLTALKAAYGTLGATEQEEALERQRRKVALDRAYDILVDYRKAVIGTFDPLDPLVGSLPKLTPDPGSTPDAPTATVVFDAATQMAKVTHTASTAADLDHYELRICVGPVYSTDDEIVVASNSPTDPREFFTDASFTSSGDVISCKVYAVTATGNEAGSNAVTVTRP
ncbi:MAG: hypothetical protein H7062_16305 [Candidatus Saccharimonas sp.]|nr:hypothetical protein [Planctomycetaceae bacterium]